MHGDPLYHTTRVDRLGALGPGRHFSCTQKKKKKKDDPYTDLCRTIVETDTDHAIWSIPNILRDTAFTVSCSTNGSIITVRIRSSRVNWRVASRLG